MSCGTIDVIHLSASAGSFDEAEQGGILNDDSYGVIDDQGQGRKVSVPNGRFLPLASSYL